MLSQIILFKDAEDPLLGNPHTDWEAWSNAYTSMTFEMPFDELKGIGFKASSAQALIVATAAPGLYQTGVGIFCSPAVLHAPVLDWTQAQMVYEVSINDPAGSQHPHPYRTDITDQFNTLIDAGELRYFGIASWGNGTAGPKIWCAELRVVG